MTAAGASRMRTSGARPAEERAGRLPAMSVSNLAIPNVFGNGWVDAAVRLPFALAKLGCWLVFCYLIFLLFDIVDLEGKRGRRRLVV